MEPVSGVLVLPVDRPQISSREGGTIGGSDGDNDGVAIGVRITISGGSGLRGPAPIPCKRPRSNRTKVYSNELTFWTEQLSYGPSILHVFPGLVPGVWSVSDNNLNILPSSFEFQVTSLPSRIFESRTTVPVNLAPFILSDIFPHPELPELFVPSWHSSWKC